MKVLCVLFAYLLFVFLFLLSLLLISDIYAYTFVQLSLEFLVHTYYSIRCLYILKVNHMNVSFSSGRAPLNEQARLFYVLSIRFQTRIGLLKLDASTKYKEWNLFVPHLDSNKHTRHHPPPPLLCPMPLKMYGCINTHIETHKKKHKDVKIQINNGIISFMLC